MIIQLFLFPVATESVSSHESRHGSITPTEQPLEKASPTNNMDFSSSIRAEVAKEHKDTVVGLEVRGGGWVDGWMELVSLIA